MKLGSFALSTLAVTALTSPLFPTSTQAQTYPIYGDYSFAGTDGKNPRGALVQAHDGSFYGATYSGGDHNTGTIFKVTTDYEFVTLHSFGAFGAINDNADGGRPNAALVEGPDGNLYGTTAEGGAFGDGTIFRVTPDGQFTTVFTFSDKGTHTGRNVLNPLIVGRDGALYGTAYDGGGQGLGTVFRVSLDGSSYAVLANLDTRTGSSPLGALVEGPDGALYGTTYEWGTNNNGTVFKVGEDGSGFAVLHVFGAFGSNSVNGGGRPGAGLAVGPDGALYGTTSGGGTGGYGTVFRVTPDGGSFSVLRHFAYGDGNGRQPEAALIPSGDGAFYGTTDTGGATGNGTVFRVTPDGQFSTLASLDKSTSGDTVPSNVILAQNGQLFGLAGAGGANNGGTIFEVDLVDATTPPPAATTPVVMLEATVDETEVDRDPGVFTVSIPEALDHDLFVSYKVKGSAINGIDYVYLKGKAKIKAGKTSKQIKVVGTGDLEGAFKKVVKMTLTDDPDGNYEVGTTDTLKVKIYRHAVD